MPGKMRRAWRHTATTWAGAEADAQKTWDAVGAPEAARLDETIARLRPQVAALAARENLENWLARHPEAALRLQRLDRELTRIDLENRVEPKLRGVVEQRVNRPIDAAIVRRDHGIEPGFDIGL